MALKYQRILLKISGEALGGETGMGFDEPTMAAIDVYKRQGYRSGTGCGSRTGRGWAYGTPDAHGRCPEIPSAAG